MVRALMSNGITRLSATVKRLRQPRPPQGRYAFRPRVESLEERLTPAVTFATQQTFTVGGNPQAVAVGDFTGDGRLDLVIPTRGGNLVSVLLNTTAAGAATASFATQQTFQVGNNPFAVAVGDLNGDGRPDLVVADFNDNRVSVLMNTTPAGAATLSFAARQTFQVGGNPASVVVGDFNGDGRPDIATANEFDGTVSVLLNTTAAGAAAASFAAQQTFTIGNFPRSVAVGDFNGDGRPDLVTANQNDNRVSVLLNTTAAGAAVPTFAAQQTFNVGPFPNAVAVGDVNGDGRPDLAVANDNLPGTVSVLLNTTPAGASTVSFAAKVDFNVGGNPASVAVVDLNGDGRPDLAVANNNDNTVSVLLNTTAAGAAAPSFAAQQTFQVGSNPISVAAGDLMGNGRTDLAVANNQDPSASVLSNTTAAIPSATPVVVGQFGSQGVWEFNRSINNWVQLTPANATRLAADPQGDVAAAFPGYGVWEYKPASGWKQLNGVDATALAMDAQGDVAANFPGYGVGEYLPAAGWRSLTGANASLLTMDANGDVAGEFPGYGVWLFRPSSGWRQINGVDASLLAMDPQGDVAANFPGYGVGEYTAAAGWRILNGIQAQALSMDARGDVFAQFAGYGVGEYLPASGWRSLTGANAPMLGADALGDVFGAFAGYGVWEFDPSRGWFQITGANASLLSVA